MLQLRRVQAVVRHLETFPRKRARKAAARALLENTELSAHEIAEKALEIAGDICIYTNQNRTLEVLPIKD